MDEQEAVSRLKRGDINGLEPLVRRYYAKAVRAAFLVTRDQALAEDIVQSSFLRAYERAHQFDMHRPFEPWFYRIVVNDAAKSIARRGRSVSWEEGEAISLAERLCDPNPGPDDLAEKAELREVVWEALGWLSPMQRAAVVLRYYLDLPEAAVADQLGASLGTVKRRLHVARKRLRGLLSKTWLG